MDEVLKLFIDKKYLSVFAPRVGLLHCRIFLDSVDKAWLISTAKYQGVNNLFRFIEEHT